MAELSLFWDGTTGDAGPYTDDDLMDTVFRALLNGDGNRGVLYGVWGELEVFAVWPSPSASPSASASASPSPSASESPSPSASVSPSASASPSGAASPSSSASASISPSPSSSASASPSHSPSESASESASPSPSPVAGLDVYVRSGAAIVYGLYYESDDVETITLPDNSTSIVVVERDWSIPNARLTYVAALTQTPTVTYDIPLARVVTAGGNVTSITDLREFCEYSGQVQQTSVVTEYISSGTITPAKMENQTRRVVRGAGAFEPDASSPATRTNYTRGIYPSSQWREDVWQFNDLALNAVWASFRVPADFTGTTMEVFAHLTWDDDTDMSTPGYEHWGFYCWTAQPDAAFAVQNKSATIMELDPIWRWWYHGRFSLGTITVSAGDVVQIRIWRDGTAAADTSTNTGFLHLLEVEYTADS